MSTHNIYFRAEIRKLITRPPPSYLELCMLNLQSCSHTVWFERNLMIKYSKPCNAGHALLMWKTYVILISLYNTQRDILTWNIIFKFVKIHQKGFSFQCLILFSQWMKGCLKFVDNFISWQEFCYFTKGEESQIAIIWNHDSSHVTY